MSSWDQQDLRGMNIFDVSSINRCQVDGLTVHVRSKSRVAFGGCKGAVHVREIPSDDQRGYQSDLSITYCELYDFQPRSVFDFVQIHESHMQNLRLTNSSVIVWDSTIRDSHIENASFYNCVIRDSYVGNDSSFENCFLENVTGIKYQYLDLGEQEILCIVRGKKVNMYHVRPKSKKRFSGPPYDLEDFLYHFPKRLQPRVRELAKATCSK